MARKMIEVYLGLGCNLGNRRDSIEAAFRELEQLGSDFRSSSIFESEPWGYEDEKLYLNAACAMKTQLSPHELHRETLKIERAMGRETDKRKSGEPYRARRMDVDILFYGDLILSDDGLEIPHPRLHLRKFVLTPLLELNPELNHPVLKKTVRELYRKVEDESELRVIE